MSEKLISKMQQSQLLSKESEQKLLNIMKPVNLRKNEPLLSQDEMCKNIYYLESGFLISLSNLDGKVICLDFTLAGNFTTNLNSLQNKVVSNYSIIACEDSVVWIFSKQNLLHLYADSHEFVDFSRQVMEQLLIDQQHHINLFKLNKPIERYRHILQFKPELLQKTTLTLLSSYLGISRETLSRIRKRV